MPIFIGIFVFFGFIFKSDMVSAQSPAGLNQLCGGDIKCAEGLKCSGDDKPNSGFCQLDTASTSGSTSDSSSNTQQNQNNNTTSTSQNNQSNQNTTETKNIGFLDCVYNPTACTVAGTVGIFNYLATWSIGLFTDAISKFSAQTVTPEAIYIIWKLLNNFVSMFFIVIFIVMAYATLFKVNNYGLQRLFPSLVAVAILLNFTYIIPVNIVAIGDQITSAFVKPIQGSLETNLAGSVIFAQTLAGGADALDIITRGVVSIIFAIIITVVFFILTIFLFARLLIVWGLIITAPVVAFAYIIPAGRSAFDRWSSELMSWAFFPAIYSLCLFFGITILQLKNSFSFGGTKLFGLTISDLIFFIFAIAILLGALIFSKAIGAAFGLKTSGFLKTFESKIGLEGLLQAGQKGDIKGFATGLGEPFKAVGRGTDKFISKVPILKDYYQGSKRAVERRAAELKQTGLLKLKTFAGPSLTNRGLATQESTERRLGRLLSVKTPIDDKARKERIDKARKEVEGVLSRYSPQDRLGELNNLAKNSRDENIRDAATLIKLENDVANGKKYDTEEYIALIKQFGGEKTELGKNILGKIKDNLIIPGTISKIEEQNILEDATLTDDQKQAKIEARKKEEATKKQKIALGEDPATQGFKEYRKEIFKNLVKRGVIQGIDAQDKISNIKKGFDQLVDPSEQGKLIRDLKLSDIFKDVEIDGKKVVDGNDLLIKFAQSNIDPNDLFNKALQEKAIMDIVKKSKIPSNFISSQEIEDLIDRSSRSLSVPDQNNLINISSRSETDRARIIDDIKSRYSDPKIKEDLEKIKLPVTSASDKIDFYNKLISGLSSDEDKKDFKTKINASDIFKEKGDLSGKTFKSALSNFDDEFIGKALKYAKDNPKVLDEEGSGYEKALEYLKDTDRSDFIRKIEDKNPLVTGRYNSEDKIKSLLEGATTDFYKNKDITFYDNINVKKYIYTGIKNNKFNAEQKKELNKSKGAKSIIRLYENIRKTEEAIADPSQAMSRIGNTQKLSGLIAELGFNPA